MISPILFFPSVLKDLRCISQNLAICLWCSAVWKFAIFAGDRLILYSTSKLQKTTSSYSGQYLVLNYSFELNQLFKFAYLLVKIFHLLTVLWQRRVWKCYNFRGRPTNGLSQNSAKVLRSACLAFYAIGSENFTFSCETEIFEVWHFWF